MRTDCSIRHKLAPIKSRQARLKRPAPHLVAAPSLGAHHQLLKVADGVLHCGKRTRVCCAANYIFVAQWDSEI